MVRLAGQHSYSESFLVPSDFTILQLENNQANAELVKQLVDRRRDCKLLTASNATEGVEMARAFQPDLILMDLMMPQTSGLDTLTLLREDLETSHIPVMIVTSNAFPGVAEKCLAAGAFACLTKPYKLENLMTMIDAGLKRATATQ